MPQPTWDEGRIQSLLALLAQGKSNGFIAKELGVTIGAIAGKRHRMGVKIDTRTSDMKKATRMAIYSTAIIRFKPKVTPRTRRTRPKLDKNVNMAKLDCGMCRFPLWEDGTPFDQQFYCGAQCGEDTYCTKHDKMTHYKAPRYYKRWDPIWSLTTHSRPVNSPKSMVA